MILTDLLRLLEESFINKPRKFSEVVMDKIISSKNLYFKESTLEDCSKFAVWEASDEITPYFSINKGRDYEEVKNEFLERQHSETELQFSIFAKESDELIGRIYISNLGGHDNCCDITRIYIGDVSNRGKGLGEEAVRLIMDYLFDKYGLNRITIDHFMENNRAGKLYLKIGFKYIGVARQAAFKNNEYYDLHLMDILRSEYM